MRYLLLILLFAATAHAQDAEVSDMNGVGSYAGITTILSPFGAPAGVGSDAGVENIRLPYGTLPAVSSTAGTGYLTVSVTTDTTGVGSLPGVGSMTATGIIKMIVGEGAVAGVGILRTLNAKLVPLRVVKHGVGSVLVTGDGINCGIDCETEVASNSNYTLTWSRDATESDVYSWGNACLSAERATTCTIPTDSAGQKMYVESDGYAVASIVTGSFRDPICRTGRGTAQVTLQRSLQAAYDAVSAGTAYMPIDCIAKSGDGPLVMNNSINVELVGGWTDFFPGQITPGVATVINGGLTIKYGSFVVGSYGGAGAVTIR